MDRQIVYSSLITPDGTRLVSRHRHDYVTHTDANGKEYMLDGGKDYIRCSNNGDEVFDIVYLDDEYDLVRKKVEWGRNYDKNMNRLPKTEWVKLCDLTDDHLEALIEYPRLSHLYKCLFIREKQFRQLVSELF